MVAVMKVGLICDSSTANRRWEMVWLPMAYASTATKYGAPWCRKASMEKMSACSLVRLDRLSTTTDGPPMANSTAGMITTAMAIIAINWAKDRRASRREGGWVTGRGGGLEANTPHG